MPHHQPSNLLLRALPQTDYALLAPLLEPVQLPLRYHMERPHDPVEFAYFIETGVGSMTAKMSKGHLDIEVALMGRDGMVGTALVMGDRRTPFDCFMQVEGSGLRIPAEDLLAVMSQSAPLTKLLRGYTRALGIQTAYTALANGRMPLEARLARWLLMIHDRIDGDKFAITHEFIAIMLGVRRPGVTVGLHVLEGEGMIRSQRGLITIADRERLMQRADGAYSLPEAEYTRLTGIPLGRQKQAVDG